MERTEDTMTNVKGGRSKERREVVSDSKENGTKFLEIKIINHLLMY